MTAHEMSPSYSSSSSFSSFTITYFLMLVSLTPLSLLPSEESEQSQALPSSEQVKSDKALVKEAQVQRYHCEILVEGPHLTLGDPPFTPNSGFTPGTPVFTHFTSARRRYAPHEVAVKKQN